jgi:ABC-type uncharacterized transport system substrate-binding protein
MLCCSQLQDLKMGDFGRGDNATVVCRGLLKASRREVSNHISSPHRRRATRPAAYFAFTCLFACSVTLVSAQQSQSEPKRILILASYHQTLGWTNGMVRDLTTRLSQYDSTLDVNIEYMDTKRFHDQAHYERLYSLLENKAGHEKYDVIIAVDNNALLFLLKYRDGLYPDVPIVFCAVDHFHDSMYTPEPSRTTIEKILAGHDGVTGVMEDFDHEQTIEVALRLHPAARYVFLVNDGINKSTYYPNLSDQDVATIARKFEGRAEFVKILLSEDKLEALGSQIKPRADQSIVLLANSFLDKDGDLVLKSSALAPMLRCEAPIYVVSSSLFQVGCAVGGYVNSSEGQSRQVMDMVAQILEGRSPDDIPIVEKSPNMYIFNYRHMTRFGITRSQLPLGSIVLKGSTPQISP